MIYLKLIMTAAFWGGTFIAGRHISNEAPASSIAFLRFATASIMLLWLTSYSEKNFPPLSPKIFISMLLLGLIGVAAYNIMYFIGLRHIEAGRASLIIASCPIFITLFSVIFFKERLSPLKIFGILISIIGVIIVISIGNQENEGFKQLQNLKLGKGEALIFGCVLCWVTYSIIGKSVMNTVSPLVTVTYSSVIGTLALSIPAFHDGLLNDITHFSLSDWLSIGYLAFFGTVIGFVWFYQGIKEVGPTKAGLFINFVPICAIIQGWLILGEKITIWLAVGAALVILGVWITNRRAKA